MMKKDKSQNIVENYNIIFQILNHLRRHLMIETYTE